MSAADTGPVTREAIRAAGERARREETEEAVRAFRELCDRLKRDPRPERAR